MVDIYPLVYGWAMQVDADKLKRLRQEKVLSQRELARLSGLTHQTVWRYENGFTQAHPRTIRKLAEVLDVEPKELVNKKGEQDD